jgi:hypothetical protein
MIQFQSCLPWQLGSPAKPAGDHGDSPFFGVVPTGAVLKA